MTCVGSVIVQFSSIQFSPSVVSDSSHPMNYSTPGLPVHHQLSDFTQTQVHRVGDSIQPSHNLMCGKLKFCHHLPLLPPTPASFSFFISVNGIFILLVGLVRNLGFILDSFFFSLSYCTSKSRSYQRDLQNSARV